MNPSQSFRDEALRQLQNDILSVGWLRQMAELDFAYGTDESLGAVFDLVVALVDSGVAVVGCARSNGKMVLIEPWEEKGQALKEKMNKEVDTAPPIDKDFAFWLQLTKHYNRK